MNSQWISVPPWKPGAKSPQKFRENSGQNSVQIFTQECPQSDVQVTNVLPYGEECGEVFGDKC